LVATELIWPLGRRRFLTETGCLLSTIAFSKGLPLLVQSITEF